MDRGAWWVTVHAVVELDTAERLTLSLFTGGSASRESACSAGDLGLIPGEEYSSSLSIFAWGIPWTEESDGLQSLRSQRGGHNWCPLARVHAYIDSLRKPRALLSPCPHHLHWGKENLNLATLPWNPFLHYGYPGYGHGCILEFANQLPHQIAKQARKTTRTPWGCSFRMGMPAAVHQWPNWQHRCPEIWIQLVLVPGLLVSLPCAEVDSLAFLEMYEVPNIL